MLALSILAGSTPLAVNVSAPWVPVALEAVITYTASPNPDVQEYERRGSFGGTKYNADSASVLGSHPAGVVTPFRTDAGLVAPGSRVFYKVFVIVTSGNEKGSKSVSVTRP